MLDHLDAIDWSKLTHAYGPATDVPDMLRALASADRKERYAALHAAYGNIFHQGTRYPATPHAIPFLIELAADPDAHDLGEVLTLLTHCVAGYFSPTFGPVTASGAIWGAAVPPMTDYGETAEILAACERAAAPAIPVALRLLADGPPDARARAAHLLAALHAFAPRHDLVAQVRGRLMAEGEPAVRAMLAFALTHLLPPGDPGLARLFDEDPDPLVRALAALGCVRRGQASAAMIAALLDWLTDEDLDRRYAALPFQADGLAGDIGALLPQLEKDALSRALPTLRERLRTARDFGAVGLLQAALTAAFGDDPPPEDAAQLSPAQRELLEALAHNQAFWSLGNALSLLLDRGLPSLREEMAAYLGIQVAHDPREAARVHAEAMAHFGHEQALQSWLEVIDQYPDDQEALANAGLLLVEQGDHEQALPLFDRALAAGPAHGEHRGLAHFGRGNALSELGRLDEALASFERAYEELAGDQRELARQNRIALLQRLDRPEEALALAYERPPRTAEDYYHRGLAEVKAGRYKECLASIAHTLAGDPAHANAHYTAACAHALLGDDERALQSIARALELDPDLAPSIAEDPDFTGLRGDARFRELVGE